jgi:very-short-patch-repair endonuclease
MKPGELNKMQIKAILETIFGAERVTLEHRFHSVRRWRFDYAVPEIKLAVEYNGHGGFIGKSGASGHSSIKGITNDAEKMNSAIAGGWRVLAFTALHFKYNDRVKHNLTDVRETIMNALAGMQKELEK